MSRSFSTSTAGGWRRAPASLVACAALVLGACGGDGSAEMSDPEEVTATPMAEPGPPSPDPTGTETQPPEDAVTEPAEATEDEPDDTALAAGVYRDYDSAAVSDPGYDTTIIFFHASWCPECRAFEQSIEAGPIPDGVQILKADYDTAEELKQKYGVTIQTTFVKVDADGEELSSWVGYQKDRSIDTILEELE